MRITVLVGLIGAGKTMTARSMSHRSTLGLRYHSFDGLWHGNAEPRSWTPEEFARNIPYYKNAIIDGWWTWEFEWWKRKNDYTLDQLGEYADVHLMYLKMTEAQAWDAYMAKRPTAEWADNLMDTDAYKASIPARIAYMERKVMEWGQ